ncbi:MAG: glycoside hydrolase family 130 protein [Asticcacaulis sp.]
MEIKHSDVVLTADPGRVVLRPFSISVESYSTALGMMSRAERVCRSLLKLTREECTTELASVSRDFSGRHFQTRSIFLDRFNAIKAMIGPAIEGINDIDEDHAALIGAYFCHEYSFEAAAIMNPSVVPHPDQVDVPDGAIRFLLSARTVGEGHISTISFREGYFHADGTLRLEPESDFIVAAKPVADASDGPVTLSRHTPCSVSGTVIFPITRAQSNGLEDLRLVRFEDGEGGPTYLGTYTAYSGREIGCELLETGDFDTFRLTPFRGVAARHKGLALFPRRINGKYAAIGRLDHESLYYLETDDPLVWNYGDRIASPRYAWELVQMGNCGSPIELDEGWLLLTHGVGAMRRYSIGAMLLDKSDPRQAIGRSRVPLLSPDENTREGYVPNVVYTCGAMRHGEWIFLPYAVADSSIRFASIRIADMLQHLRPF